MNEQGERPIISIDRFGSHVCQGCGGITPEGEPTGNRNIKHFALHSGSNSAFVITWCNECAAKVARFLLDAWKE